MLPRSVRVASLSCALAWAGCESQPTQTSAGPAPSATAAAVTSAAPVPSATTSAAPTDAEALAARERATLLASPSPLQWKRLVEKYPDSKEAAEAREKLARRESVCADLPRLTSELAERLQRETALAAGTETIRRTPDIAARNAAWEKLGREAAVRAGPLKESATDVDEHDAKPGEEAAKKLLSALYWALADATRELGEELARPAIESEESYDEHSARALAKWSRALTRLDERMKRDVQAAEKACAPRGDAGR